MTDEPATVLVVDDETNITTLFDAWLDGEYAVRTANSGSEALEQIDESIDVALLDRRMPGISGDELLEEIRDRDLDVRVAMVTAIDPDFDVLEMGFDDYLTKPVSREDLEDLVDALESRKHYAEEMQEYYSLAAKRAALESSKPAAELVESEEYDELLEKLDEIETDLDGKLSGEEDFVSAFQDL
ncbi:response regulator [Halanaeroarchaeum sulfurireducens]|uniref:Response regulator receiver protein n=1 Tax=Halanaeroarchaeum sulfurireducens TaxID=1604004 RepID=A0A0F7PB19_9EURY|nr:response regulator [Halanaeroarchaeum sulfurireducens]AKH96839.1 response regulator receiver protein [Halanaeroarchaeum sulfurireducens]ALG81241.1 response regulator receiver protein [Halanaeroarchaeum sulfurireducens]